MILKEKIVTCPGCKKKLKIPNKHLESARQVRCPVCQYVLFVNFISDEAEEVEGSSTVYGPPVKHMGNEKPYLAFEGKIYFLEESVNIIGRKASTSTANIQIDTNDRYMGRHHAVITKRTDQIGNFICTLKPKDAKNGLCVNGIELTANDEVNLLDGASIKMGNTMMVFHKS